LLSDQNISFYAGPACLTQIKLLECRRKRMRMAVAIIAVHGKLAPTPGGSIASRHMIAPMAPGLNSRFFNGPHTPKTMTEIAT
jgi:hypothetical protein